MRQTRSHPRRFFVFFLLCAPLWLAAAPAKPPREAQLEALKKQFPAHLAGAVSERSDPHIQVCYQKYKRLVDGLQLSKLPTQIVELRRTMEMDIDLTSSRLQNGGRVLDDQARRAMRQNILWLEQRMAPFVSKLSRFQRGT